jgi:protein SCO1
MEQAPRKFEWAVWSALVLTMAVIAAFFVASEIRKRQARDVALPLLIQLPDFTLTNQFGQEVSLRDLRGQVWIADIIFTRCPGACPLMTKRMGELQNALPKDVPAKLVTLTTDPEFDTPAVLKKYSERFGADPARWIFLTGTKKEIAHLALRDGLKFFAEEVQPEKRTSDTDLYGHSTIFAIVDKNGRLRASFEYDDPATVKKVVAAVKKLLHER